MPAASLFIVIVACLGEITCVKLDPDLKRCPDGDFYDLGYSPHCTYTCRNGSLDDDTEYWGDYKDGIACVALTNANSTQFTHIGTCKNGTCVKYDEANIQQVWSTLPELQAEFHDCDTISSDNPVENCLYICKKSQFANEGFFFGIYRDRNTCKVKNGELGICLSGFCHGKKYFSKIDDDSLKP
ncbi:uncharacterized protein LOC115325303 [Ixodes scapularis]|uniref:uncharacterized protein LOC115325303 n=1 Tax=Ixodes scapularis TaxID=6945 RepID=UPI001A9F9588|nr:uncharacterized protein LOC115325303 [Ixodes scapularis]